MKHSLRQLLIMGATAVMLTGLLLLISRGGILSGWCLDLLWQTNGPIVPSLKNQVTVIGIDNATLRQHRKNETKLSRRVYAELIDRLTSMGARIIGFDVMFDEPASPDEDAELLSAVQRSGRVISNCRLVWDEQYANLLVTGRSFFQPAALGEGFANFPFDADHFVRRTFFYAPKGDLPCRISFALALYLAGVDKKAEDVVYKTRTILLPKKLGEPWAVPLDYYGRALIPYCDKTAIATASALDVLENRLSPEFVRDRFILIGGTADEFRDAFHTPFSPRGDMPGVEIHAHMLATLLSGQTIREISGPEWWGTLLAIGFIGALLTGGCGIAWGAAIKIALSAFWFGLDLLALNNGLFMNLFDVWAVLLISWVCATACHVIFLQMEKNKLSKIFRRYLSPNLLEELLKHPEALSLGGARKEAIVLFADIRSFTHMCEDREPEKIIAFLNAYFTAVTKVISDHGGILDKYIGDGLMAFFGLPIPTGDEATRAVSAALHMKEEVARLKRELPGKMDFPIQAIGIGINGGEVVVGNVGSEIHQEYTLLGDTVNVSARLESLCSSGEILISNWIKERLPPEKFRILPRGPLKVKGRKKEIETFEVQSAGSAEVPA
jgi:adenylate cyclase